jgi:phosphoribosylglycinamide formyltransferase-1
MSLEKNNFAVFVSGYGRGAIEIIKQYDAGEIIPRMSLLVSTDPLSNAIIYAEKSLIPVYIVEKKYFSERFEFESVILKKLESLQVRNIFLAVFKYLLSECFIDTFKGNILNIHPSLLPAFKGHKNGIQQALDYGVKVTGVTIHKIDKEMDKGVILSQAAVAVDNDDNFETLDGKIFSAGVQLTKCAINNFF